MDRLCTLRLLWYVHPWLKGRISGIFFPEVDFQDLIRLRVLINDEVWVFYRNFDRFYSCFRN